MSRLGVVGLRRSPLPLSYGTCARMSRARTLHAVAALASSLAVAALALMAPTVRADTQFHVSHPVAGEVVVGQPIFTGLLSPGAVIWQGTIKQNGYAQVNIWLSAADGSSRFSGESYWTCGSSPAGAVDYFGGYIANLNIGFTATGAYLAPYADGDRVCAYRVAVDHTVVLGVGSVIEEYWNEPEITQPPGETQPPGYPTPTATVTEGPTPTPCYTAAPSGQYGPPQPCPTPSASPSPSSAPPACDYAFGGQPSTGSGSWAFDVTVATGVGRPKDCLIWSGIVDAFDPSGNAAPFSVSGSEIATSGTTCFGCSTRGMLTTEWGLSTSPQEQGNNGSPIGGCYQVVDGQTRACDATVSVSESSGVTVGSAIYVWCGDDYGDSFAVSAIRCSGFLTADASYWRTTVAPSPTPTASASGGTGPGPSPSAGPGVPGGGGTVYPCGDAPISGYCKPGIQVVGECLSPWPSLNPLDYFNWMGCEISGIPAALANIIVDLFEPHTDLGASFGGLQETVDTKAPFGFFSQLSGAVTSSLAGSGAGAAAAGALTLTIAGQHMDVGLGPISGYLSPYRDVFAAIVVLVGLLAIVRSVMGGVGAGSSGGSSE